MTMYRHCKRPALLRANGRRLTAGNDEAGRGAVFTVTLPALCQGLPPPPPATGASRLRQRAV
jgi:hypothetical protein